MKKLLQEFRDLEKFKDCLTKDLYQVYKEYLCEEILKEYTTNLADLFRNRVLSKNEIDSEEATVDILKKLQRTTQQYRYEKRFGKIVPSPNTHLETLPGNFCTKNVFKQDFKKEDFSDFDNKEDLSVEDLIDLLLDGYLEMYDDNGWLISKADNCEDVKNVEIPNLIS